jgi:hypothetical protein
VRWAQSQRTSACAIVSRIVFMATPPTKTVAQSKHRAERLIKGLGRAGFRSALITIS